jgi:hypothetical protein
VGKALPRLLLALAAACVLPAAAGAETRLVSFDDLAAGTVVSDQ